MHPQPGHLAAVPLQGGEQGGQDLTHYGGIFDDAVGNFTLKKDIKDITAFIQA